jgi:hypothetical protein
MASDSPMREMWDKKTNRGHPSIRSRTDGTPRHHPRHAAAGLSRRSEGVRGDAFRQIYSQRAPTEAQSRA